MKKYLVRYGVTEHSTAEVYAEDEAQAEAIIIKLRKGSNGEVENIQYIYHETKIKNIKEIKPE